MVASHMLPLPKAFLGLRIAQLVVGIVVLGLAAYGVTFIAFDGDSLILFTSLATMIITIYNLVSTLFLPTAYNYWAILALDIFAVIFWLISFALLGAEIAAFGWGTYGYATDYDGCTAYDIAYGYCARKRSVSTLGGRAVEKRATTDVYTYRNSMAAAAGLGGLEFLLFIVTLIFTSLYLHRHRKAGGHSTPNHMATSTSTSNNNNNVPVIHEPKNDVELQQGQHQHQQQQTVYTQQQPVQPVQEISSQQHQQQHVAA